MLVGFISKRRVPNPWPNFNIWWEPICTYICEVASISCITDKVLIIRWMYMLTRPRKIGEDDNIDFLSSA